MDGGNPSDAQWEELFKIVKGDEEMKTGLILHPGGKTRMAQKWSSLAIRVNNVAGATARKDAKQWKAAWNGMKCRARAAYRKHVLHIIAAGGIVPDLESIPFANIHHKSVMVMLGTDSALKGLQLPNLHVDEPAPAHEGPQVAPPMVIPNADALLNQFVLHGAGAAAIVPHPQPANHVEIHPAPANEGPEVAVPVVADDDQIDQNVIMHVAGAAALAHLPPPMHVEPVLGAAAKLEVVEDLEVLLDDNLVNVSDAYSAKFEALPSFNVPQTHDVIVLSSDDEAEVEPGSAVVKFEPWTEDCIPVLEDTPVNVGRAKSLHTPPSGTGYTPGCKKRLNVNYKQDECSDISDMATLVKENTEAMEKLYREIQRFRF